MAGEIDGIDTGALWRAWKEIRRDLRRSTIRDVIDFLEYDIEPKKWMRQLLRQIAAEEYEPRAPRRFNQAKSNGFSRRMTFPAVMDLVLYRAVVDHCYKRIRKKEGRHVYFEQKALSAAQHAAAEEASAEMRQERALYGYSSKRRWQAWLNYDEYRRLLILDRVYPYIVIVDVSNFFDSILYSRIADALSGLANARITGLLFFLLERLSIRDAYTESPRVGLPVDEFDCSRKLAHLVLFPHDNRMIARFGEAAFVRWMDDQNIGVSSKAEGMQALALAGESLARLHLTANAGKSKLLSLAEARRHFHLATNAALRRLDALPRPKTKSARSRFRRELSAAWDAARRHEGVGEWEKILKWFYRLAALCQWRGLRRRASNDLIACPRLSDRIANYIRVIGSDEEYLTFAQKLWTNPEQVYPDVNITLLETLLRLEANPSVAKRIRVVATDLLAGELLGGNADCVAVAPLLLLRFGDRRSLPRLRLIVEQGRSRWQAPVIRSAAVTLASASREDFKFVRQHAAKLWNVELAQLVRMIERIQGYADVPNRIKARLLLSVDPLRDSRYLDMRAILAARLITLNDRPAVRRWLKEWREKMADSGGLSENDQQLLKRLVVLQ